MKMPRSQNESENVQFVQELAEVDGPFEAPIDINFRDLIKVELPSLVWNRGETCPKKMKITNTGHTVIVSGKWKCERPYLTGGPLLGKYVFSQIHFHWGRSECDGSEHKICGEGFPLEMHVAHFKTDYATQECALREKDGMVVVVYLFKLQEEPNESLKKIINSLSCVRYPSTSQAIDPRPILTLLHPFTDDYFMYWGSVVTSTCAHILLWIICREPFGISREQVCEFRKIMDVSQQPICKNSRDIQPLHKRNVFHVNASKHLNEPLLPIKKIIGCYCKASEENVRRPNNCRCQSAYSNQEDVEGGYVEASSEYQCLNFEGLQTLHLQQNESDACFGQQTYIVQKATIEPLSMVFKKTGSDPLQNHCCFDVLKRVKSEGNNESSVDHEVKLVSQSCCNLPEKETKKIKSLTEKRKPREKKRSFNHIKPFSQIMHSLEALKNHTFKKFREIESINQEIKEIQPFCNDSEDKKWLRNIERIMTKQKKFTIKSSQGCLSELKKLAKECNFDKYFEPKALSVGDNNQKMSCLAGSQTIRNELDVYNSFSKKNELSTIKNESLKHLDVEKALKFSNEAQKLVQNFFEDIKETEDLQSNFKKCLKEKNSNILEGVNKNYITQKMFKLGNLEERFFTKVTSEKSINELENTEERFFEQSQNISLINNKNTIILSEEESRKLSESTVQQVEKQEDSKLLNRTIIHLRKAKVPIVLTKTFVEERELVESFIQSQLVLDSKQSCTSISSGDKVQQFNTEDIQGQHVSGKIDKAIDVNPLKRMRSSNIFKIKSGNFLETLKEKVQVTREIPVSTSTESTETPQMIIARIKHMKKNIKKLKRKNSDILKISSKTLFSKSSCKRFEGFIQQKKLRSKITRSQRKKHFKQKFNNKDEKLKKDNRSIWKQVAKAKFKLEIEKSSNSTEESESECSQIGSTIIKENSTNKKSNKILVKQYISKSSSTETTDMSDPEKDISQCQILAIREKLENKKRVTLRKPYISEIEKKKLKKSEIEKYSDENNLVGTQKINIKSSNNLKVATQIKILERFEPQNENEIQALTKENSESAKLNSDITNEIVNNIVINTRPPLDSGQGNTVESHKTEKKTVFTSNKEVTVLELTEENVSLTEPVFDIFSNETDEKIGVENDTTEISKETHFGNSKIQNKMEFNIGFFTTSSQVDDELLPKVPEVLNNQINLKRSEKEKYAAFRKKLTETKTSQDMIIEDRKKAQTLIHEINCFELNQTKTDVSLIAIEQNKDPLTSASCSTVNKTTNKPHSAETLHSFTKTRKQKFKKRPNCSKRNSRHYLRREPLMLKKYNKSDSKQLQLLRFNNEEQLKILSENVAKYLKQTLTAEENNKPLDNKNSSPHKMIDTKMNPKNNDNDDTQKLQENSDVSQTQKIPRPNRIPVLKKKGEKERRPGNVKKLKTIKSANEFKENASLLPSQPFNNFIKLNKQMATKWHKKYMQQPPPKTKPKEKEKQKTTSTNKFHTELKTTFANNVKNNEPKMQKKLQTPPKTNPTSKSRSIPKSQKTPKNSSVNEAKAVSTPKNTARNTELISRTSTDLKTKKGAEFSSAGKPRPVVKTVLKMKSDNAQKDEKIALLEENAIKETVNMKKNDEQSKTIPQTPLSIKQQKDLTSNKISNGSKPIVNATDNKSKTPKRASRIPMNVEKSSQFIKKVEADQKDETSLQKKSIEMKSLIPTIKTSIIKKSTNIINEEERAETQQKTGSSLDSAQSDEKPTLIQWNMNEALFKEELEYFIKLQMCFDTEIATTLEDKTNFSQPQGTNKIQYFQKPEIMEEKSDVNSAQFLNSSDTNVILIETKDLLESSTSYSDLIEETTKYCRIEDSKNTLTNREIVTIKTPENSGEAVVKPLLSESPEELNSEDGYDCKISITLNTNSDLQKDNKTDSYNFFEVKENLPYNQSTTCLKGSSSQTAIIKSDQKWDVDIPFNIKEKLLKLLETEIKREVGIKCESFSGKPDEALLYKWEDSDPNNQSLSTVSSCDTEELTRISSLMKKYVTFLNETQVSEKESYDEKTESS